MSKMKKALSFVLLLCMLLTLAPVSAFAEPDPEVSSCTKGVSSGDFEVHNYGEEGTKAEDQENFTGGNGYKVDSKPDCGKRRNGVCHYVCADCGDEYYVPLKWSHSKPDDWSHTAETYQAPTCTTPGWEKYNCKDCQQEQTVELPVDAENGHNYKEQSTDPTCTEPGQTGEICDYCHQPKPDTSPTTGEPAKGHQWTDSADDRDPADDDQDTGVKGWSTNKDALTKRLPAGKDASALADVGPGECKDDDSEGTAGKEGRVCSVCGAIQTRDTKTTEHDWVKIGQTDANCVSNTIVTYKCNNCQKTRTDDLYEDLLRSWKAMPGNNDKPDSDAPDYIKAEKAWGHRYELNEEERKTLQDGKTYPAEYIQQPVEGTAKDEAQHTLLCLNCKGLTKGEDGTHQAETKKVNCKWNSGVVTKPTCAAGGYTTYTCSECGFTVKADETEKDATKHDWDYSDDAERWEVVTEPNCQTHKNGTEKRTCQNPNHETPVEEWRPVKWEHTLPADPEVNTPPTCTTKGHQTFTCTVCHEKVDKELDTVDHKLVKKERLEPTCKGDGYNEHWECEFKDDTNWYSDESGTKIDEGSLESYKLKKESATNEGHKFSKDPYVAEHDDTPASGSFVAEKPADCIHTGVKAHYVCTICHKQLATSDDGESFTLVEASALTIKAGKNADGGDLENNGHIWKENEESTPPTCEHGTLTGGEVCSICQAPNPAKSPTEAGDAKGHIWERTGVDGAKGDAWTNDQLLTHLDDSELVGKIKNNMPEDHNDCTQAYTIEVTCTDCEQTKTWNIQSAGHAFARREGHEEEDFLPPTCTKNARVKEYCTNAGCEQTQEVDLYDELKASMTNHPELGLTDEDLKEYQALGHQFTVGDVEGEGWIAITKATDETTLAKLQEVNGYDANKLQHYRMCQRKDCDQKTDLEHGAPIQVADCDAASQPGKETPANCVEPKTTVKKCTKCKNAVTTYGDDGAATPDGQSKDPSNHRKPQSEVEEWTIDGTDNTNEDPFKHTHKKICPDCEQPYAGTEESLSKADKDTPGKFTKIGEDEPANCSHGTIRHYECATCGFEVADEEDDKKENGHEPDLTKGVNGKVYDVDRTCKRNGVYHYVCKNCGVSYGHDVDPKGHQKAADAVAVRTDPATCTEPAYKWYRCSLGAACAEHEGDQGALFKEADPDSKPLGHTLSVEVTKNPTCTDEGVSVLKCTNEKCNATFDKAAFDRKEHVVKGTADSKGYNLAEGTEEAAITGFTGVVEALGHNLKVVVDTSAGCETPGTRHIECTRKDVCGFTATDAAALNDVTYTVDDGDWNTDKTWTTESIKAFTSTIAATGHTMVLHNDPATCSTPGSMTLSCENKATCGLADITTDDGFAAVKSNTSTYHWPEELNLTDGPQEGKVDFKAHTDADPKLHQYATTREDADRIVADETLGKSIPEDAIVTGSGEIFLATNDCTHAAGTYQVCVKCGTLTLKSETSGYLALGHDWSAREGDQSDLESGLIDSDWEIITEASCGVTGEKQVTCQRCGAVETREIPALVHNYQMPAELTEQNVTAATCTDNAKTHKVCANNCGEQGDVVDLYEYYTSGDGSTVENHEQLAAKYQALGHNFTPEGSDSPNKITGSNVTGTAENFTHTHTQHCERCSKDIVTNNHPLTKDGKTTDTCQKKGTQTYSCDACGLKYTDPDSGTAWTGVGDDNTMNPNKVTHTGEIKKVTDVAVKHASRNGVTHQHCDDCGKDFGYDIVDKCTSDEVKGQHTFAEENAGWEITKKPTCTENGTKVKKCTTPNCTYQEEEQIESTGHKFNEKPWATPDDHRVMTACEVCGELKCLTDLHTGGDGNKKWDELTEAEKCKASVDEAGNITYTHHGDTTAVGASEATCTDPSSTGTVTCNTCGLEIPQDEVETTPAKGHTLSWVAEQAPTCTVAGKKGHYHCSTCNKDFLNDPKYGDGSNANALFYKYSKDYASADDLAIAPLGHELSVVAGTAATCTKPGTATLKCVVGGCNATFTADQVASGEHKVAGAAGEVGFRTAEGTTVEQVNGFTGVIAALGHDYVSGNDTTDNGPDDGWTGTATCTAPGTKTRTCVREGCTDAEDGHTQTEEQAALGHDFDEAPGTQNGPDDGWQTDTEASCDKAGSKHRTCVREGCNSGLEGAPFSEVDEIPQLQHTAGEWKNDENGILGEHWQVCANCGQEMPGTRENHNLDGGMSGTDEDATCTTPGTSSMFTCTVCGKTLPLNPDSVKPALGHDLVWVPEQPATCDTPGVKAHFHCNRVECGKDILPADGKGEADKDEYLTSEDYAEPGDLAIGALGHSFQLVPANPGDCENYGWDAYYTCENCDKVFSQANAESVLPGGIPYKDEYGPHSKQLDVENSTVPTPGSTCGDTHKEYICSICGEKLPNETEDLKGDGSHDFSMDDVDEDHYVRPKPGEIGKLQHKCTKCGLWIDLDMGEISLRLAAYIQERFGLTA